MRIALKDFLFGDAIKYRGMTGVEMTAQIVKDERGRNFLRLIGATTGRIVREEVTTRKGAERFYRLVEPTLIDEQVA